MGGDFALQGTFHNVWRHFWLSQLGQEVVPSNQHLRGRGRSAPKHSEVHRTDPHHKELVNPHYPSWQGWELYSGDIFNSAFPGSLTQKIIIHGHINQSGEATNYYSKWTQLIRMWFTHTFSGAHSLLTMSYGCTDFNQPNNNNNNKKPGTTSSVGAPHLFCAWPGTLPPVRTQWIPANEVGFFFHQLVIQNV